ncbi:mechanosensitive ion channel family protein [Neobacillus kokaensis]|uniref:Mechanosensitive ion channel protein MscS n=1 Tax=Neobacillus kokaensis TaxID=2759023 RepID=A0ABQ3N292_9BACI|nr:mechanosensitive ion channel family protein [Neobacillus kokaensis]GHH98113.1 mechanosensitive ion channel protein MscS [Neobacillus kokaensis]
MEEITTEKGFKKNVIDKLQNEDTWMSLGEAFLKILIIMAISNIIIRIGKVAIHNVFKLRNLSPLNKSERREETLAKLLDNTLTYVVYFIAIMMVLSVLGIDVKALIAGAGVVGLAVGFGAQSLVKDIISGFFIIFEDQFSVGDHVRIGEFEGNVEAIGLRTTKIKSWTGEVHILPNGSITQVTNFSLNNSIAVIDIAISNGEDIDKAQKVIEDALAKMPSQYEQLVAVPTLLGIQTMGPTEVVLRVTAETLPMQHAAVTRMIRKDIKSILDEYGIRVPSAKFVMLPDGEK